MTAAAVGYANLSNEGASAGRLELQASGEDLLPYLAALKISPDDRVLEIGCGAGALTRALAHTCEAEIWGIDVDAGKIAYCREAAEAADLRNLFYRQVPIGTASREWTAGFDVVCCRYVLMYALPDSACAEILVEMARCLRPGGRLVAFEADINFAHRFHPPLPDWAISAFDAVVTYYRDRGLIEWRRGVTLGSVFESAGLTNPGMRIVEGRIIRAGAPEALVAHDSLDLDLLLGPPLAALGRSCEVARVAECYRRALRRPDGLCYTAVFAATWTKPGPQSMPRPKDMYRAD